MDEPLPLGDIEEAIDTWKTAVKATEAARVHQERCYQAVVHTLLARGIKLNPNSLTLDWTPQRGKA